MRAGHGRREAAQLGAADGADPARLGAYKRHVHRVPGRPGRRTHLLFGRTTCSSAHQGLGISALDFDRFFVYFLQSVYEVDLPQPARSELLAAFAMTKEEVVERW